MTKNTTPERAIIDAINTEVAHERENQIVLWGQQDHPSLRGETDRRSFARTADYWKEVNNARAELENLSWDGILLEEVFEALCEVDPLLRRAELLQVAAVATAEIESIDRLIAAGIYTEGFEVDDDTEADSDDDTLIED